MTGRPRDDVARMSVTRWDTHDPEAAQQDWLSWLAEQEWTDYQALPSQLDDELALAAEPSGPITDDEPLRLRYVLTNTSDTEVTLSSLWYEMYYVKRRSAGMFGGDNWRYSRPQEQTEDEFFALAPGESVSLEGRTVFHNDPHVKHSSPPTLIIPGLVFDRKGATLGLDAWVGEVWADEIKFPVEPGYGTN